MESPNSDKAAVQEDKRQVMIQKLQSEAPEFVEAYESLVDVSRRWGVLPAKTQALIQLAAAVTMTNLHAPSARTHLRAALRLGATRQEIIEVFQLVAALGLHSCTFGVPILFDEMKRAGIASNASSDADLERQGLKDEFVRIRGYWGEFWDQVLQLSPAFFKAYLRFSAAPWKSGRLEPKVKELIYIAIDCNTTHLYEQGLRIHIQNAFAHGATPMEIMEVYQLVATMGMQAYDLGVSILDEEAPKRPESGGGVTE